VPRESPKVRAKMGQDGPSSNVVLLFWWSLGNQLPVKTTKNRLKWLNPTSSDARNQVFQAPNI
jgi:hypothetical protein